jgi:hypothetical protein
MSDIENTKPENLEPEKKISEAQRKATKKYRDNNKEKVNNQRKEYYKNRITTDPEFVEYKRQKAKEYYHRKKALLKDKELVEEIPPFPLVEELKIVEIVEQKQEEVEQIPVSEVVKCPVVEELPTSEVVTQKKRTRSPKQKVVKEVEEKPIEIVPPVVDNMCLNIVPIAVKKNRTRK